MKTLSPRAPQLAGILAVSILLMNTGNPGQAAETKGADPAPAAAPATPAPAPALKTSTEWRDDEASLKVVELLNKAYAKLPFSVEYEGVLDHCPFSCTWSVGPNLPRAWKGGAAGMIDGEIVMAGGLWMPGRTNATFAFNIASQKYTQLPSPPVETQYTQGNSDGKALYMVGGRSSGTAVQKLSRDAQGNWKWERLPDLPAEGDSKGRWLGTADIVPGKWLFVLGGIPKGRFDPAKQEPLPALRLRLDKPGATWEPMAPYPAGKRRLIISAVIKGKLYCFGGSYSDPVMRPIQVEMAKTYKIDVPFNGETNYRDAYCYDPETDKWQAIRRLPFPMLAGWGVPLQDRYILLMGSADVRSYRVGAMHRGKKSVGWTGYGDRILCYDIQQDNYSRVGVMAYGVATIPWVTDGQKLYGLGGEPCHGQMENTDNVLQIGTIHTNAP